MPQTATTRITPLLRPAPLIVRHPGELLYQIRKAREVAQADIAALCAVKSSTISRFERDGTRISRETYKRYVQALASPAVVPLRHQRLTPARQQTLLDLYRHYYNRSDAYDRCASISFAILAEAKTNEQAALVREFAREQRPAFIIDDLGFIHVVNGALLNLFAMTPHDSILSRWEVWHYVGANLLPSAPAHQRYLSPPATAAPGLLARFFEDEHLRPYLFTPQLQCLQRRLQQILIDHDQSEHLMHWHDAISMRVHPTAQLPASLIVFEYDEVGVFQPQIDQTHAVRGPNGHQVRFRFATLDPIGRAARQIVQAIRDTRLYFAAQYDTAETMHANTWPEVTALLEP